MAHESTMDLLMVTILFLNAICLLNQLHYEENWFNIILLGTDFMLNNKKVCFWITEISNMLAV